MCIHILFFIASLDIIPSYCQYSVIEEFIYPVIGQNYVLNLMEYFPTSNTFNTNSSYYLQQLATVINDTNVTNIPDGVVIDTTSNLNLATATVGGQIAALVLYKNYYFVYVSQVGIENKTPIIWTQLSKPISRIFSYCSTLVMLSNQNILVSCQSNNSTQTFYYFEQKQEQMMPFLYQTGIYVNPSNSGSPGLQSYSVGEDQWQIFVIQGVSIMIYNVSTLNSKISNSPLNITFVQQFIQPNQPIGTYIISPYSAFICFQSSFVILDIQTNTSQQHTLFNQYILQSMGVFTLGYSQDSFEILVTFQTAYSLQNFYIISYQSGLQYIFSSDMIELGFYNQDQDYMLSLQVSPEYVVVSGPSKQFVYVYPGWQNSNKTQIQYWYYSDLTTYYFVFFNPFTQDIYVIGRGYQSFVHIGFPFILINLPANSSIECIQVTGYNKESVGYLSESIVNFQIFPVLQSHLNYQINYTTSGQNLQYYSYYLRINNFQSNAEIISGLYLGSNLTYEGEVQQPNYASQAKVIQLFQVPLNVQDGEVLFSQILPYDLMYTTSQINPQNGYFYVLQLKTSNTNLQIYFCNELACGQAYILKVNSTVLGVATSNNQQSGKNESFLAIFYNNSTESVYLYTFQEQTFQIEAWTNITVNSIVPTMTVSSIQIIADILYIITATPQSLQVVPLNNITNSQVFSGLDIVPRNIYSSPLYPNLIFLDNTYELRIYRVLNRFMSFESQQIQTFPYQLQQGSTVGVGILFNGIYIAESNGTNEALTLYPPQALDAFLNTSLTNLTISIPLEMYRIKIQNPVVSAFSSSHFYLSIIASDLTNQLAVFQYTGEQLNVLYFSKYLPSALSQISLATVIYNQFSSYDVLCHQYAGNVEFYQITNNTYAEFIPGDEQVTQTQNYSVSYTATTPGYLSLGFEANVEVYISGFYMTPISLNFENPNQTFTFLGNIEINPANHFTGFVYNYQAEFFTQDVQVELNSYQIIQPIVTSNIQLPNGIRFTSSFVNAYNMNSTMGIYQYQNIPGQHNYYSLYQMDNTTFTSCPFMFMYNPDLLVIVCTNANDSYLVYNNNSTNTSFANLVGTAQPNLTSALYNQLSYVFAFQNNLANTQQISYQLTAIQLTYDGQNLKKIGTAFIQNNLTAHPFNYSIFVTLNSTNNIFSFGVAVIAIYKSVSLYAIEQNVTTYNLAISKNYTIIFPPSPKSFDFIAIQMYSVGTYNTTSQKISMIFVLQTTQEGYVYEFVSQPTLNLFEYITQLKAIKLFRLMPIDTAQAVAMLVQNSSIVTFYRGQEYNPKTIVGVFTLPDLVKITSSQFYQYHTGFISDLYFISYIVCEIQHDQCSPTNIYFSSNSTLFFTLCNLQYIFQIQPRITLTFNLSNLKQLREFFKEQPNLLLTAVNSQKYTSVNITGSFVLPEIYGDHSIPSHSSYEYGFGITFFILITSALIILCANSQKKAENYETSQQEVEM